MTAWLMLLTVLAVMLVPVYADEEELPAALALAATKSRKYMKKLEQYRNAE